ncbi:DUF4352 domain-containing protein [Streptomyces sp. C10-9-1]|uniref:DUF4190 domain-containing protein n=1 Tax=Streptomyces sp. C10-9-1 TaxID=1859285 RepID=UPI0021126A6A|nr:DUF4190 domain-containing protein [Streptomyces sp. C10-9-1]MCQ6555618.1 DUF4352 domain-containing protein [Streptomyces sp. C10-9-1]
MSQPTQQPPHGTPQPYNPGPAPAQARNGLGTTALVLGIIGLLIAFVPLLFWLGGILGLLALIFGLVGLGRAKRGEATNKGVAVAGTVLAALTLVASVFMGIVTVMAVDEAVDEINKAVEASAPKEATDAAEEPAAEGEAPATGETLAAGDSVIYDDDVTVTVSAPKAYSPSEFAIGHTSGNKAYQVTVVIENAGTEKFDTVLTTADARAGEQGVEAEQIFDDTVGGGFEGTIAPGKKATVVYAFDAPADAKTLTVEISPGISYDSSQWELTL